MIQKRIPHVLKLISFFILTLPLNVSYGQTLDNLTLFGEDWSKITYQVDKEPLFDSIDTIKLSLMVNAEMMSGLTVNVEVCGAAASDPMLLATDLADWLVKNGTPFRQAHERVGKAVAESVATKVPLDQLDLAKVDEAFTVGANDASSVFSLKTALEARTNPGAPSFANVHAEVARWKASV